MSNCKNCGVRIADLVGIEFCSQDCRKSYFSIRNKIYEVGDKVEIADVCYVPGDMMAYLKRNDCIGVIESVSYASGNRLYFRIKHHSYYLNARCIIRKITSEDIIYSRFEILDL